MASEYSPQTPESADPTFKAVTIRPASALLCIVVVIAAGIVRSVQAPDPEPDQPSAEKSFLEWLRYPIETNPGLRLPRAPDLLNSVSFDDDGLRGFVVGGGGTILATIDGGNNWFAQGSRVSESLNDVHCDAQGKQAWVVGSAGTSLPTDDGGEHCQKQRS